MTVDTCPGITSNIKLYDGHNESNDLLELIEQHCKLATTTIAQELQ